MRAANIAVVLSAAGLSRRMGQDKLLRSLPSGRSLLEDRIRMVKAAGVTPFVAVPHGSKKTEIVERLSAIPVPIANHAKGLGHSLSVAVCAVPDGVDGIMVLLADLPDVTADDLINMMARFDEDTILRASTQDGKPGHPVIFPARYRPQFKTLSGDQGARALLKSETVMLYPLPGKNAVRDLDTPEDWAEWETAPMNPRK